tara:strand:- start:1591 stop:1860 length:270 start_codon:yes stop_codon:yes gene_type:complete
MALSRQKKRKLEFLMNTVTIVLLLGLVGVSFMIMKTTAESNSLSIDVTNMRSKKESKVVQEMRLMTLQMKNLQKDIEEIRDRVENQNNN